MKGAFAMRIEDFPVGQRVEVVVDAGPGYPARGARGTVLNHSYANGIAVEFDMLFPCGHDCLNTAASGRGRYYFPDGDIATGFDSLRPIPSSVTVATGPAPGVIPSPPRNDTGVVVDGVFILPWTGTAGEAVRVFGRERLTGAVFDWPHVPHAVVAPRVICPPDCVGAFSVQHGGAWCDVVEGDDTTLARLHSPTGSHFMVTILSLAPAVQTAGVVSQPERGAEPRVLRGEAAKAWAREHDAVWHERALYDSGPVDHAAENATYGERTADEYTRASCRNHSTPWDHPRALGRPGDHGVTGPGGGDAPVGCGPRRKS